MNSERLIKLIDKVDELIPNCQNISYKSLGEALDNILVNEAFNETNHKVITNTGGDYMMGMGGYNPFQQMMPGQPQAYYPQKPVATTAQVFPTQQNFEKEVHETQPAAEVPVEDDPEAHFEHPPKKEEEVVEERKEDIETGDTAPVDPFNKGDIWNEDDDDDDDDDDNDNDSDGRSGDDNDDIEANKDKLEGDHETGDAPHESDDLEKKEEHRPYRGGYNNRGYNKRYNKGYNKGYYQGESRGNYQGEGRGNYRGNRRYNKWNNTGRGNRRGGYRGGRGKWDNHHNEEGYQHKDNSYHQKDDYYHHKDDYYHHKDDYYHHKDDYYHQKDDYYHQKEEEDKPEPTRVEEEDGFVTVNKKTYKKPTRGKKYPRKN